MKEKIKYLLYPFLLLLAQGRASAQAAADTLDVVNWNLEWFADGDTHNASRQVSKTRQLMNRMDADIYALCEIVNKDSLRNLANTLNDAYGCVISSYASFAYDSLSNDYAGAQKLALLYRKSIVRNVSARPLMQVSNDAYYNFSSGRYPFLVRSEIKGKDGQWKPVSFVVLHAKANSDYSSCQRRQWGASELKDTLDQYFASDRFLLLGDFNDDLKGSICSPSAPSAYEKIVNDSSDNNSYKSLTLPLSLKGEYSIQGFSSLIDHVVASNEMYRYYLPGSARSLRTSVKSWVSGYESDVSDHYPILTRFVLDEQMTTSIPEPALAQALRLYPNPATHVLYLEQAVPRELHYRLCDAQGRLLQAGAFRDKTSALPLQHLVPGLYILQYWSGDSTPRAEKISIVR